MGMHGHQDRVLRSLKSAFDEADTTDYSVTERYDRYSQAARKLVVKDKERGKLLYTEEQLREKVWVEKRQILDYKWLSWEDDELPQWMQTPESKDSRAEGKEFNADCSSAGPDKSGNYRLEHVRVSPSGP